MLLTYILLTIKPRGPIRPTSPLSPSFPLAPGGPAGPIGPSLPMGPGDPGEPIQHKTENGIQIFHINISFIDGFKTSYFQQMRFYETIALKLFKEFVVFLN